MRLLTCAGVCVASLYAIDAHAFGGQYHEVFRGFVVGLMRSF
jgi:hypothetical protein